MDTAKGIKEIMIITCVYFQFLVLQFHMPKHDIAFFCSPFRKDVK